nr:hypothetical protein [Bacteroidales bacterium]
NPEDECFPSALLNLPPEQELLGINIDEMGRDAAAVKVVAQMFGLKFDALWQRYEREQRRRRFFIIAAVLLLALAGIVVALVFSRQNKKITGQNERITKQNERITKQNEEIVKQSEDILKKNERLVNDSVIMAAQMDSIVRRDALINLQRDSIFQVNNRIIQKNNIIINQNNNIKVINDSIKAINVSIRIINDSLNITNKELVRSQEELKKEVFNYKLQKASTFLSENKPISAFCILRGLGDYSDLLYDSDKQTYVLLYREAIRKIDRIPLSLFQIDSFDSAFSDEVREENEEVMSPDSTIMAFFEEEDDELVVVNANNRESVIYQKTAPAGVGYFSSWYYGGVLEISSDNRYILSYGFSRTDSYLTLVDTKTDKLWVLSESSNYDNIISSEQYGSATFSPDGKDLMLFGSLGIKIIQLSDMTTKYLFKDSKLDCKYGGSNKEIITGLRYETDAYYWEIGEKRPSIIQFKEESPIWHAIISPDTKYLALATEKGVQIWDIDKRRKTYSEKKEAPVHRVLYSHDGTRIAVDGELIMCLNGQTIVELDPVVYSHCEADRYILDMAFSPDDSFLCVWQEGDGCAIFSGQDGKCIGRISGDGLSFLENNMVICDDKIYLVSMEGLQFVEKVPVKLQSYQVGWENYRKTTLGEDDELIIIDVNNDSSYVMITYPDCQVDLIKKDGFREWMIPDKDWIIDK